MRLPMSAGVGFRMRHILIAMTLALCSVASWGTVCTQFMYGNALGVNGAWSDSRAAGCASASAALTAWAGNANTFATWDAGANACLYTLSGSPSGTLSESQRTGDYCANPCVAGQHSTMNVTTGWARTSTPDANDMVVDYWTTAAAINAPRCDGQCVVNLSALVASYRSQIPAANGLHRVSEDINVVSTGQQCSAASSDADPNTPPASCPGYVGKVNGKDVCVGTASTPLPQTPKTPGTPPDTAGNPAAGPMPSTGSGSGSGGEGRTPVTGNGGNTGGGSSAATPGGGSQGNGQVTTPGAGGTGGGTVEVNVDTCGLPGKPACKIDESGTGNGSAAYDGAKGELSTYGSDAVGLVGTAGSASGKDTGWGFGFSLPTGCSALDMGAYDFALNVCQFQPVIHDLLSLVWVAATLFLVIGMVGRAVGGGSA